MGPQFNWPGGLGLTFDDASTYGPILAVLFGLIGAWIALASITGWLAGRKNRDSGLWFVLAFFTGPVALLAICLKRPAPKQD